MFMQVFDMEKKNRMNIMIAPSDKNYLEKKYGGVSRGIATMCMKERDPSEALRDIVLPKNKALAQAYIPNYLNSKDNGMEQSLTLTKKIIMKECGVQERTAINYIKQLAHQGFFEIELNKVRISVVKT